MPISRGAWRNTAATPDELAVLPGVMPIVGDSDAEAREKLAKLQSWINADQCHDPGRQPDRL